MTCPDGKIFLDEECFKPSDLPEEQIEIEKIKREEFKGADTSVPPDGLLSFDEWKPMAKNLDFRQSDEELEKIFKKGAMTDGSETMSFIEYKRIMMELEKELQREFDENKDLK